MDITTQASTRATEAVERVDKLAEDAPGRQALVAAASQADALAVAAIESPNLYMRTLLARLSREWSRAASDGCEALVDGARPVLTAVGAVPPGALVFSPGRNTSWATAVRTMTRDGQVSLHLEDDDGRPVYLNFTLSGSPVVVAS